jgi:GNAT superfamily N-acetyltransferase
MRSDPPKSTRILTKEARFRPAAPAEASALLDLAVRAKAHWGYDAAFLADWRAAMNITPQYLERCPGWVLEIGGQVAGFYTLCPGAPEGELAEMFLAPERIGQGWGRRLWEHAVATARGQGWTALRIESEPYAEGFYQTMGAVRIGKRPSSVRTGRVLPVLHFALDQPCG